MYRNEDLNENKMMYPDTQNDEKNTVTKTTRRT